MKMKKLTNKTLIVVKIRLQYGYPAKLFNADISNEITNYSLLYLCLTMLNCSMRIFLTKSRLLSQNDRTNSNKIKRLKLLTQVERLERSLGFPISFIQEVTE